MICSKLIFCRLLEKITTENLFHLNSKFFKRTDEWENNIVIPHKAIFYKWYVDDIINRRKKHEKDLLFKKLNNYHPKIKLTTEINPLKFLDTELLFQTMKLLHLYVEKKVNYLFLENLKFLSIINVTVY